MPRLRGKQTGSSTKWTCVPFVPKVELKPVESKVELEPVSPNIGVVPSGLVPELPNAELVPAAGSELVPDEPKALAEPVDPNELEDPKGVPPKADLDLLNGDDELQ
ncbi:Hypothetical predicted protein [Mytilus galloprovincialis]|uniref:Uncharacterized protein n=1 Tax=Mytilus galloprovincialis TaxID=29158 RepID=A0A8B6DE76_MYTGA|nr:Hypothetical predicted protein [Mytilus galloprovincialis]